MSVAGQPGARIRVVIAEDQGMVLDERKQPIATCRPLPVLR